MQRARSGPVSRSIVSRAVRTSNQCFRLDWPPPPRAGFLFEAIWCCSTSTRKILKNRRHTTPSFGCQEDAGSERDRHDPGARVRERAVDAWRYRHPGVVGRERERQVDREEDRRARVPRPHPGPLPRENRRGRGGGAPPHDQPRLGRRRGCVPTPRRLATVPVPEKPRLRPSLPLPRRR